MLPIFFALAVADTPTDASSADALRQIQSQRGLRLVHVWATWCGPCVKEFDRLSDTTDAMRPKGLQVIALSVDGSNAPVKHFLSDRSTSWRHLRITDGPKLPQALAGIGAPYRGSIPYNLLLDADGTVLETWTGGASAEAVRSRIEPHLSQAEGWTGPTAAQLEALTQGMLRVTFTGREGDALYIDNWQAGTVPFTTEVIGGLHDLRVEGSAGSVRLDQFLVDFTDGDVSVDLSAFVAPASEPTTAAPVPPVPQATTP